MIWIKGREWNTLEEALRYQRGYNVFPRDIIAEKDSPEATGWYDAEREWETQQDDLREEQD